LRISQTVEAVTLTPRTSSSPWILRCPQVLFSRARRSTSRRMDRRVGDRLADRRIAPFAVGILGAVQERLVPHLRFPRSESRNVDRAVALLRSSLNTIIWKPYPGATDRIGWHPLLAR
jgi:hypothetical protein